MLLLIVALLGLGYWSFLLSQQKASVIYAIPDSEKAALAEKEAKIREKEITLRQQEEIVSNKVSEIDKKEEMIGEKEEELSEKERALRTKEAVLQQEEAEIKKVLSEKKADLQQKEVIVSKKVSEIDKKEEIIGEKEEELSEKERALRKKEEELRRKESVLGEKEVVISQKERLLSEEEIALRQKNARLRQKEAAGSEERPVLARKQPVSLPHDTTSPASRPFPPPEALMVPKGKNFLALNCDIQRVFIFQGSGAEPLLKAEFEHEWPLGEGLFILGKDPSIGEFVFHHMSFLWGKPYVTATDLWKKVSHLVSGEAVPLMAYSSRTKIDTGMIEKAREIEPIIASWSDAWESMDADSLVDYYGDIFTTYYLNLGKPMVFSKDQFYARKKEVLMKSGFVSLKTSEPIFIIDPDNPKLAIAFFYQKYRSKIYADEGAKALYFSLVDEAGGKETWKIVAKLWLPL
jgi:hypothetical protein